MTDLTKVGADWGGTGTFKPFTADISGAQRIVQANGKYWDLVRQGLVWSTSARAMTLAAGQGYAQAANATINWALWNPQATGKQLVLLKFAFNTISGTPAAGEVNYQLSAGNVITSIANGVHVNNATGQITGSVAKSWYKTSAAAIAGTVAFNDMRPAFAHTATAAANPVTTLCSDDLDGEFVLTPGMAFTFGIAGAGTSHVASVGVVWAELPYLI